MDVRALLSASSESLSSGATMRAVTQAHEALMLAQGDEALELLSLHAVGGALWSRGEVHHAALVLGAADRLRERTGQAAHSPLDDLARSSPGWEDGRHLSTAQVLGWLEKGRDRRGNPTSGWGSLTPSERQVVELAVDGLTNPAIARHLYISTNTVKTHLQRAYRKLGVTRRAELKEASVGRERPGPS